MSTDKEIRFQKFLPRQRIYPSVGLHEPQKGVQEAYQVDVEKITEEKRAWIAQDAGNELLSWPQHLFENFAIVGLTPDYEITQIAEDLCEKEHRAREQSLVVVKDGRLVIENSTNSTPSFNTSQNYHSSPPWPAYEPAVLYNYRTRNGLGMNDKELAGMCFPYKVSPRKLKRSPSWSALNEIIFEKHYSRNDQTFVFMLKAAGASIPLYGVCCYVDEVLHRPPLLASAKQCLIVAPRCYCLVSRYPFFSLHFQVLSHILGLERLYRTVEFTKELFESSGGPLPPKSKPEIFRGRAGVHFNKASSVLHSVTPSPEDIAARRQVPVNRHGHTKLNERTHQAKGRSSFEAVGAQEMEEVHQQSGQPTILQKLYSDTQSQGALLVPLGRKGFKRAPVQCPFTSTTIGTSTKDFTQQFSLPSSLPPAVLAARPVSAAPKRSSAGGGVEGASQPQAAAGGVNNPVTCLPFMIPSMRDSVLEEEDMVGYEDTASIPKTILPQTVQPAQVTSIPKTILPQTVQPAQVTSIPKTILPQTVQPAQVTSIAATVKEAQVTSIAATVKEAQASKVEVQSKPETPFANAACVGRASMSEETASASSANAACVGRASMSEETASASSAEIVVSQPGVGPCGVPQVQDALCVHDFSVPMSPLSQFNSAASPRLHPDSVSFYSAEDGEQEPCPEQEQEGSKRPPPKTQGYSVLNVQDDTAEVALELCPSSFKPDVILDKIYEMDVMNPGDSLQLEMTDLGTISFTRPQFNAKFTVVGSSRLLLSYAEKELAFGLNSWAIAAACRLLSLDNLLFMLTAALLEQQLAVFCPDISACSAVVLSLVPMLQPFSWQCLMLPVTPSPMIPLLDAPVPFIMGLQYKTQDVVSRCADLVRVNVYKKLKGRLLKYHSSLRECVVDATRRPIHVISKEEVQAAMQFSEELRQHLLSMLGDIRPHVITNVSLGKKAGVLMKSSLLETIPAKDRGFMKAFLETQMFSVWCDSSIGSNAEDFV
ncbi:hypothetical protein CEUSTIGMA_g11233.t1 [Chlamydomonas eustigma]|uniref:UDENN domain-containing protein n=1 Tax=Chlamydomonas eustigma TaxID=1157962 RepID=A0A250XL49_9CHLO|nr:hypothetical protein CEUSTIGMA_g11233.t1 [Chlamydomonas eustigma]|eukprot:GAX83808.1 hypothetical protein CEUSTIGMA_g11233.t1 [Chlamydomonas eustigma]